MKTSRRGRLAFRLLPLGLCLLLPACQQRMARQPSHRPDEPSAFFPDGQANRPVVPGTVARGHLRTDAHLFAARGPAQAGDRARPAGLIGAAGGNAFAALALAAAAEAGTTEQFPFPVTYKVLRHGRNRYMIYCVVCHDPLGTGRGIIVQRGYTPPPSYHIERLRKAPVGHFFEVITKGYGSMPDYAEQVPPRDRWAIIAYIRALQLSQHFPEGDLTVDMRREWQEQGGAGRPGGQP